MGRREFTIVIGKEKIPVEGHQHRNVAIKYLMKRRRSLLMTRDKEKVERLFHDLPRKIIVAGKQVTKNYGVKWEKVGTEEFEGARFTFTLDE